eukprot:CAMPEP_0113716784 /NCGR_PEP_ID=MMETSP0038_2-20120614/34109_1 /TAXON_ID=2898 /ORGANISM="Cryptomonas paramecium" /LENGTH=326 /DNA_ID=CAMNT_0000644399 /DNA_START=290 /DNA_END=1268 /DNA_ORIENTATION=+ /assembly_acc=CAM_ASM_000170
MRSSASKIADDEEFTRSRFARGKYSSWAVGRVTASWIMGLLAAVGTLHADPRDDDWHPDDERCLTASHASRVHRAVECAFHPRPFDEIARSIVAEQRCPPLERLLFWAEGFTPSDLFGLVWHIGSIAIRAHCAQAILAGFNANPRLLSRPFLAIHARGPRGLPHGGGAPPPLALPRRGRGRGHDAVPRRRGVPPRVPAPAAPAENLAVEIGCKNSCRIRLLQKRLSKRLSKRLKNPVVEFRCRNGLGNWAGLELVQYETSCMPDLVRDNLNTTGRRLRTGDEANNVAQRIEPLVRLMPSWGVKPPPSCDFGPRNLEAGNEPNSTQK